MTRRESRTCSDEWVRFSEIEDLFTDDVQFLIDRCPKPSLHVEARRLMLRTINNRLSYLRARQGRESASRDAPTMASRTGRTWADQTGEKMERTLAQRYRLRADRSYWQDATLNLKLEELRAAAIAQPRDLARINDALRSLLMKVVMDWENDRLVLHWRHGGQSIERFYRRRLIGTSRTATPASCEQRRPAPQLLPPMMPTEGRPN